MNLLQYVRWLFGRRIARGARPIDATRVIALRREGMSCSAIGHELGHHSGSISRVLIRHGMRTRYKRKGDA